MKRREIRESKGGGFEFVELGKADKVLKRTNGFSMFEEAVATAHKERAKDDPEVEVSADLVRRK